MIVEWKRLNRYRSLIFQFVGELAAIEDDMTEDGIANQLLETGAPKENIVLAFQPPEVRRHTEFAVT